MLQIYDMGPTALLPLWRKACWGFFRPKNPTASAGFEPANLGTKGQHATSRPPKPLKNRNQLDATYYFIVRLTGSTCFGYYYAHHQELTSIMLITTLVVSFYKDGGGSVNVKLRYLVVCVRCEVLCRLVVAGNVLLLILSVVILEPIRSTVK